MNKKTVHVEEKNPKGIAKGRVIAAAKPKPKGVILSVSVNGNTAEHMKLLGQRSELPEIGAIIKVLSNRFQNTKFAKSVKVESISLRDGITVFHATTGF